MHTPDYDPINRWLGAERAGRDGAAEAALVELFDQLPEAPPPAGFADRVMARAGLLPAVAPSPAWPRGLRWLAAAGLVLACGALVGLVAELTPRLGQLVATVGVAGLFEGLAGALAVTGRLIATLVVGWYKATLVAIQVAHTPQGVLTATAMVATSALALRLLSELIARERSFRYVDSTV